MRDLRQKYYAFTGRATVMSILGVESVRIALEAGAAFFLAVLKRGGEEEMRLYSLGEVCALFSIDPVTLRRWMRRINITPHVDPSDGRRRYLDQAQLLCLAEAHQCVLVVPEASQPYADLAQLRQTVQQLAQRVAQLEVRQCACSPAHVELVVSREET